MYVHSNTFIIRLDSCLPSQGWENWSFHCKVEWKVNEVDLSSIYTIFKLTLNFVFPECELYAAIVLNTY